MDTIQIRNLWKRYNRHFVLKGLELDVRKGETVVILGRSGVGKSVLLRLIMGIEKADRGSILVNGVDIASKSEAEFYEAIKEMGMLFQASALFDSMTVGENTAFYLKEHYLKGKRALAPEEIKARVKKALKMVGLENKENMMPADLSGGMRKRAALARLIAYRPAILLYDEPTTGLDPITAMHINDLILEIQRELGATSVVVTHDICSAFHVADRIALNHEGKIAYIATKEEFVKIDDSLVHSFLKNSMPEGGRP